MAIEAIDSAARIYKISFEIRRQAIKKNVSPNTGKWIVSVMGKKFINQDFIIAAGEAVTLVYKAHQK